MPQLVSIPKRAIFGRLSVVAGNLLQLGGCGLAGLALAAARSSASKPVAIAAMISAWILLYFFCHGIAHWFVGRLVGIRFAFYTVGGTGNPEAYPGLLRWVFERLPFFGVQTEKESMQAASPMSKAIMWSAGVTSSGIVPTMSAVYAWHSRLPASMPFLIFAVIWAIATLASNWTSRTGDFSKARRVLISQ
jgi:hypothetical protein